MQRKEETKREKRIATVSKEKAAVVNLPSDIAEDLREGFQYYETKEEPGIITVAHYRNILHNFGYHRLGKREQDFDSTQADKNFPNCGFVDYEFCQYVIWYRWTRQQGDKEEAYDAFRVFDKKDRF